jgi:hypothetical protein
MKNGSRHDRSSTVERLRRLRRFARVGMRLAAVALLIVGATALKGHRATAATVGATATIANPETALELPSGGSQTAFTVTLPVGAACSGDTANDGFHVYSYLVEKGTDLSSITFINFPSQGYGFVDNTGTYYGPVNTAINTGQIIGIPNNFVWGPLAETGGGSVPLATLLGGDTPGVWEAGIVCANASGAVSDSWNTEVTFAASDSDPGGFTWSAVPGVPTGGTTTTSTDSTSTTSTSSTSSTSTTSTTVVSDTTTTLGGTVTTGDATTATNGDATTFDTTGSATTPVATSLPNTGGAVHRNVALGILAIGLGVILLGLDLKWRERRVRTSQ